MTEKSKRFAPGLPPEIREAIRSLHPLKSPWFSAFYKWCDTGSTEKIAAIVRSDAPMTPEIRLVLAYVLEGGKRGVTRNHKRTAEKIQKAMRATATYDAATDLQEKIDGGEPLLRGESFHQKVAEEVNRNLPGCGATDRTVKADLASLQK